VRTSDQDHADPQLFAHLIDLVEAWADLLATGDSAIQDGAAFRTWAQQLVDDLQHIACVSELVGGTLHQIADAGASCCRAVFALWSPSSVQTGITGEHILTSLHAAAQALAIALEHRLVSMSDHP
jgi:hypothetical protein